jgi:hypothetical protein
MRPSVAYIFKAQARPKRGLGLEAGDVVVHRADDGTESLGRLQLAGRFQRPKNPQDLAG